MSTSSDPPAPSPEVELSPGRRRAFAIATAFLPLLFFVVLEGGLRLAGYGEQPPLFVEVEAAEGRMTVNRQVARRYFANTASVPTPNPDLFLADKPEGTLRIIAQGGSSAAGYPFYRGASFPQILGTRLRLAYPDREIEVVNTAMAAVNSFTLLDLVDEVIEADPDVVVIYAGHNEYYGALGAASTESVGGSAGVTRLYLSLRSWRTVQLVRNTIGRVAALGAEDREIGRPPSNTLMARMIGEQSVPYGGEIYEKGLRQFEGNLDRILARYQEAGIPVYVSTLASNERDQRPFITAHTAGADTTAWFETAQAGADALFEQDFDAAIGFLEEATALDSLAADAHFALGHAYDGVGRTEEAREAWERARDLDALRFRAPRAFNDLIRQSAEEHGARLVDGDAAFRAASPGASVGSRLMLEHLHPNLDGYSVLADAFFDAFVEDELLGEAPRPTPAGALVRLVTPMDSVAGRIRVAQLTAGWPFRPEEAKPFRLDTTRTPAYVAELAQGLMEGDPWLQSAATLADRYEADGRIRDALLTRRAVVQAFPFLPEAWSHLATLEMNRIQAAGRQDRLPYVAGLFQQALDQDSTHVPALAMLGALALQAGDRSTAIQFLERAQSEEPETKQVLYNLSGAYLMERRFQEAEQLAEQLVTLEPDNPRYQALLEGIRRDAGTS